MGRNCHYLCWARLWKPPQTIAAGHCQKGSSRLNVVLCKSRASEMTIPSKSPLRMKVWQLYKGSSHVRPRVRSTSVFLSLSPMKNLSHKNKNQLWVIDRGSFNKGNEWPSILNLPQTLLFPPLILGLSPLWLLSLWSSGYKIIGRTAELGIREK